MQAKGPCKLCKEISSWGGMGMPCRPNTCGCACHNQSRFLQQRETAKVLGPNNQHIVNEIKYGIPNPVQARMRKPARSMKFGTL